MKHRLGIIVPFALFGLFFVLYTIVWNKGAAVMQREIAAFAASEAASGRSFSYDAVEVEGYPLALRGSLSNASWSDNQGYGFTAERLEVVTLPYDVSRIIFAPQGVQTATLRGETYAFEADGLLFSLEGDFAAAEGQNFALTNEERTIVIGNLVVNRQRLAEGDTMAADLRQVDLGGELSIRIPILQVSAGFVDEGLNIGALQFALGRERDPAPTNFSANGRLDANDEGLISGTLDVTFQNERPALMLLADLEFLGQGESELIATGLGLLTEGGTKETTLPLVLEDSEVFLGGLPFGKIPLGTIPPLTN